MQIPKTFHLSLFLVVLGLSGCNTIASNIFGNAPGERETKIQERMSELRSQSPYQVGQESGFLDAIVENGNAAKPRESDLIEAEAQRRIREELPLFTGQYDDGFSAGWQNGLEQRHLNDQQTRQLISRIARRDFEEGHLFNPGRYGFDDQNIDTYRTAWQNAEEAVTPVFGTTEFNDESPNRGD